MSLMNTALVWLRRDLRLADNPALVQALASARQVIPVFIHAPDEEAPWAPGAASLLWLHHSLSSLDASLRALGSRLIIRRGASLSELRRLLADTGATAVYWNRVYEPVLTQRDTHIKQTLRAEGIDVHSSNAALLFEPWTIQNREGKPFRVFTPFWKHCSAQLAQQPLPLAAPTQLPAVPSALASCSLDELMLRPTIAWDVPMLTHWQISEAGAADCLQRFIDHAARDYGSQRDRPDVQGTSRLAPYLHSGAISPRQILAQLQADNVSADAYVRELGWREFSYHLLYHFPHTPDQSLDARFEQFPWQHSEAQLKAWQRGRTGIPLVDAGMRELWHTGYMHNRVRMVVASFLTKNLRMHWRHGARWFWDTLFDADLANNTQGWQWTAGCGADAAPYFRVFNPVLQADKFDPEHRYLRRWLPELAGLSDKYIAQPWTAPAVELAAAGITLGHTYPLPMVDLALSRNDALDSYASLKTMNNP